jgi:hypothetical protein
VLSTEGALQIETPRDRDGTFEPQLVSGGTFFSTVNLLERRQHFTGQPRASVAVVHS